MASDSEQAKVEEKQRVLPQRQHVPPNETTQHDRRVATVYDAVAGRIGLNGFLTTEQINSASNITSKPEEVLLRRLNAPESIPFDYYNADERLGPQQTLPDSDLLKDLHAYVTDFYEANSRTAEQFDFRSFDETALIAMAILLEEACKESLGDNGDMVFTEPKIRDTVKPRDVRSQHQIIGKVIPQTVTEYESPSEESDVVPDQPRKRRRRRYHISDNE